MPAPRRKRPDVNPATSTPSAARASAATDTSAATGETGAPSHPGTPSAAPAGAAVSRAATPSPAAVTPDAAAVLTKAVARAAERLGLTRALLAKVLGVSPASVTRLYAGAYRLAPDRKEWELALLFVRLFRSLDSVVGDEATARAWLGSENHALNARPVDLIGHTEGLVRVVHYLDAARGRI